MDPSYDQPNHNSYAAPASRGRVLFLAAFGVILIGLVGLLLFQSLRFHIISTDPDTGNFSDIAPTFFIYFNQPLSNQGFSFSATPGLVKSTAINKKTLSFSLATPLNTNGSYTVTINAISSASGHKITRKVFRFVAKDIPFDKLSQNQQQTALKAQSNKPYSIAFITFNGTDGLLGIGITTQQVGDYEQAIFNYSNTVHKQFQTVTIDTNSINAVLPSQTAGDGIFSAYFNVTIDGKKYKAQLDYNGLSTARLYLTDSTTNQPIYDSNELTTGS